MKAATVDGRLDKLAEKLEQIIRDTFPHVTFTNIWIVPRESFYGDLMIDIWSIYEGDLRQLHTPERHGLRTRLHDAIHDCGIEASPSPRFVMESEAGDWKPEGV